MLPNAASSPKVRSEHRNTRDMAAEAPVPAGDASVLEMAESKLELAESKLGSTVVMAEAKLESAVAAEMDYVMGIIPNSFCSASGKAASRKALTASAPECPSAHNVNVCLVYCLRQPRSTRTSASSPPRSKAWQTWTRRRSLQAPWRRPLC